MAVDENASIRRYPAPKIQYGLCMVEARQIAIATPHQQLAHQPASGMNIMKCKAEDISGHVQFHLGITRIGDGDYVAWAEPWGRLP